MKTLIAVVVHIYILHIDEDLFDINIKELTMLPTLHSLVSIYSNRKKYISIMQDKKSYHANLSARPK
jgi:hypothetical protein